MNQKQIIAFGGLRPVGRKIHPLINYILELPNKDNPKIAYIPTATGDAETSIVGFYNRFPGDRCERSHMTLFNRTISDLEEYLLSQDIILVSGGNTANMLAVWRIHGVDKILKKAWDKGIILCGGSAGSLCWFDCGTTDSFSMYELAPLYDGLGFIPGSHCPHYDGEAQRRPLYHKLVAEGFPAGYAIDEDAAVHFIDQKVHNVVSSRKNAMAYYVEMQNSSIVEKKLETQIIQ